MQLEIIILSEVSQSQKEKYHVFCHCESCVCRLNAKSKCSLGRHKWVESGLNHSSCNKLFLILNSWLLPQNGKLDQRARHHQPGFPEKQKLSLRGMRWIEMELETRLRKSLSLEAQSDRDVFVAVENESNLARFSERDGISLQVILLFRTICPPNSFLTISCHT